MPEFFKSTGVFFSIIVGACILFWAYEIAPGPNQNFDPSHDNVVTSYFNGGGEIFSFASNYRKMGDQGIYLRIGGVCASACTFFDKLMPRDHVCALPDATFGFHGISNGFSFDPNWTKSFFKLVYTPSTLKLLKDNGFNWDTDPNVPDGPKSDLGLIWFTAAELGIQDCPA